MSDITEMSDPEFIALRRRLHDALDATPFDGGLKARYEEVEAEFLSRAGISVPWAQAS